MRSDIFFFFLVGLMNYVPVEKLMPEIGCKKNNDYCRSIIVARHLYISYTLYYRIN